MAFSSVLARERMLNNYLAAFRERNSETPAPMVVYERGWWCFYATYGTAFSKPYRKVRSNELEAMTRRLRGELTDMAV